MSNRLNWALKCDMETKSQNLSNNSKNTLQMISESYYIPMKVCMLLRIYRIGGVSNTARIKLILDSI